MRAYRPSQSPDVYDDRIQDARSDRQKNIETYQRRVQQGLPLFARSGSHAEAKRSAPPLTLA